MRIGISDTEGESVRVDPMDIGIPDGHQQRHVPIGGSCGYGLLGIVVLIRSGSLRFSHRPRGSILVDARDLVLADELY